MDVPYIVKMDSQQYQIGDGIPPILLPVHSLERTVFDSFDRTFSNSCSENSCTHAIVSEESDGSYDIRVRTGSSSKGRGFDVELFIDEEYTVESLDDLRRLRVEHCRNDAGKFSLTFKNKLLGGVLKYRFIDDTIVQVALSSTTSLAEIKQTWKDTVHLALPEYTRGALIDDVRLSHSSKDFAGLEIFFPVQTYRDDLLKHLMESIHDSYCEIVKTNEQTILEARKRAGIDFYGEVQHS